MVIESSLTTLAPLCEQPYCKASCTMYLCIFGGFSKFLLQRSRPVQEGRGSGRASPRGQGAPYLLYLGLVLLVDAICRTGIAGGL